MILTMEVDDMSILIALQQQSDFTSTEQRISSYILAHLD